jgi:lipid-A-disaccharide synthase
VKFAFVAGEVSGDLLAAPVLGQLAARDPQRCFPGIAGERMIGAGAQPWHHVRELSVRGYVEVLRELPRLVRLRSALGRRIVEERCAVLVGVDAPDFNLALETRVRAAGIPTVHFVSPSVWAWRPGRMQRIARAADRVLLVFPFEEAIYRQAGVSASYVGHPLAAQIPRVPDAAAARVRLGLPVQGTLVCLMPGSRRAEVQHLAGVFFEAAAAVLARDAQARFVLPVADPVLAQMLQADLAQCSAPGTQGRAVLRERLQFIAGRSHDCLEACDAVLVASGTATLEAALYKRPMVIAYRMPALSAWIMRRIGSPLPWVGLPNILAGESLVPELLQEAATGPALGEALLGVLEDSTGRARLAERFDALHASLVRDTAGLAAEAIESVARAGRA